MRIKTIFAATICGIAALSAVPAEARIDQRRAHQQLRIANGVGNGSLTARETARLGRQQAHIGRYEARSRADGGGLTRLERFRIEQKQDRASRNIYRQKHDRQGN
jgi:hypothetical protein